MNRTTNWVCIFLTIAIALVVACNSEQPRDGTEDSGSNEPQGSNCPGCVLRARITAAQPGDTINVAPGTYTMTKGELLIDKDLTLIGAGAEVTIIQAADSLDLATHRVIHIGEESVVSISGVTVRHGSEASTDVRMVPFHSEAIGMISSGIEPIRAEFGGGIYNQGTLTITNSIVSENFAGGGAGIFNGAKATIENSAIIQNRTPGFGAGVFNGRILEISNAVITDNTGGSGGGLSNWGVASVSSTTISENHARISGGGFNNSVGVMTLESSTVNRNESAMGGGFRNWGRLHVKNTTVSDNTANLGGGIESRGGLTLDSSTVSSNKAKEGGGLAVIYLVQNAGTTLEDTVVADNLASKGPDCVGRARSSGHNVIGTSADCEFMAVEGDTIQID